MPLPRITIVKLLLLLICLLEVVSLNAQTLQWVRQIGNSGSDICDDVITDASGNVYVTGEFQNTVDFDPTGSAVSLTSAGSYDIFICKYTSAGNLVWARRMGSAESDGGHRIALDATNNVYVIGIFRLTVDFDPGAGAFNLTSAGLGDIFICKLTNAGAFTWARRFGGTTMEYSGDIEIDNSGNVVTTGRFNNTVDFDPGPGVVNLVGSSVDVFISKLNSAGNYVWVKHLAGSSSVMSEGLAEDASGNLYIAGSFYETVDFDPGAAVVNLTAVSFDAYILKLNSSGTYQWVKRFGGTGEDWTCGIKIGSTGIIYTTGYFANTVDFDPGAGTSNLVSAGSRDIFISRLNAAGNYLSATRIGGTGEDIGLAINVDPMGNIYTAGRFSNTTDFNPGTGTVNRTATSAYDCYILKLGSALNFGWACTFGGTGGDEGRGITLDASNNVITAGLFTGTPDFDPNGGTVNMTAQSLDGFIHKLTNPSPLPIQLLNFDAYQNNNVVDLKWQTATETNNDYFTLERSSDSKEFEAIAKVSGAGNSNQVLNYSFTDENPHVGISYYRLKQTDYNGESSYSKTVAVNFHTDHNSPYIIHQNLESSQIIVTSKNKQIEPSRIFIFDATGRVVHEQQLTSKTSIINSTFLPGIYIANVSNGYHTFSQKIILR